MFEYRLTALTRTLGLAVFLAMFLAGCATVGRDFPSDQVSSIRIGHTTQSDIRATFGKPWRTGIDNGQTTWTYGRYHYSVFGQPSTKDLVVRFNSKNVVTSYSFNTTAHNQP